MKRAKVSLVSALTLFVIAAIFAAPALAVDNEDGQYSTVDVKPIKKEEAVKYIIPTLVKKKYGNLNLGLSASIVGGYDTNVNLNRYDEDGSFFMQETLGLYADYIVSDGLKVRGGYDFTSIKYTHFSDPNLLDNMFNIGADLDLTDTLVYSLDYTVDFVDFPHDKISQYTMNMFETAIRHNITDWLYHKLTYELFYKHYSNWKPRNDWGIIVDQRDRNDIRNTLTHQIGAFIGDKTFIKSENKVYWNDSNELFLDFYDYVSYKTKASLTRLITNKLYGTASFAYQYRSYDQRSVSDRGYKDQRDHLFVYSATLFYDIFPSISIGTSMDFRDNNSNENQQKYEDFVVSSGVYCVF